MGSCAAPSAKGDDKFITTDYLQQCLLQHGLAIVEAHNSVWGIRTADFCLTVDTAPGEQQDRSGYDYTFHGSLCVTGNTPF